jgi:peptidoglycan-associated lipoprotein
MGHMSVIRATGLIGCVVVLGILTGCAGRRINTSVQDQAFVPGSSSRAEAPVIKEAKVEPLARAEEASVAEEPIASSPAPPSAPALQPLSVADVYFDFDQFSIRSDAQTVLETNAQALQQDRGDKIMIEGHCDERGTLAYNLVLGERRANAAQRYLQELGVPASHIERVSYGKERPFCTEHSEACWQSNRRAHFRRP